MSLPININDLLHGKPVEWERLEFKAGWNPEAVLHTLCAFANDIHNMGGGYILIGIAEDKGRPVLPPVGLDPAQIDAIQKELLNLGFSAIAPYYHPIAVPVEIEGRHVLVLWALGGPTRPYKAKISLGKDSKDYAYYIRKGSSTIRAKGADETELMSLAATVPHDDRINQQAKGGKSLPRTDAGLSAAGGQRSGQAGAQSFTWSNSAARWASSAGRRKRRSRSMLA
jgi:ATP-dependent DNA helicase RecG